MSRSRSLALASLAAAALLLGSCGDDSADDDAGTEVDVEQSTTSAAAEAPEDEEAEDGDVAVPDACTLVEASEVEGLIGAADPDGETDVAIDGLDYSQCTWENDTGLFIVAVIGGPERYESHVANLPGEPVDGIGEEAITAAGVSSETKGATGGRTISALVDGRTLVVALKVEGQTTVDMVAPIATTVAERLVG